MKLLKVRLKTVAKEEFRDEIITEKELMEGATKLKCSEYGAAIVENL